MRCRKAGDLLSSYLDGELGSRPAAALEAHLAGCAACRAELAALRRAVNALRTPPPPVQPVGLLEEFRERLQREPVHPGFPARPAIPAGAPLLRRLLVPAGALAAALLVGAALIRPWSTDSRDVHPRQPAVSAPQMAMTPPPEPVNTPPGISAERAARPAEVSAAAAAPGTSPGDTAAKASRQPAPTDPPVGAPREGPATGRPILPPTPDGAAEPERATRMPRREPPRAAPTLERPRILLPPGVAEREEAARAPRRRQEQPRIAGTPEPPLAPPGAAGAPPAVPTGPASLPSPVESPTAAPRGWVAIRILPRADAVESEAVAGAPADPPAALQRPAADQVPAAAVGTGRQLAKQSPRDRPGATVAASLVAAMRREVNLTVSDVPLAGLLAQIGQSAGVPVALDPSSPDTMRAHAELRGMPLHEALARVAEAAGLVIAPQGDGVLLKPGGAPVGRDARSSVWSAEWGSAPRLGFPLPQGVEKAR